MIIVMSCSRGGIVVSVCRFLKKRAIGKHKLIAHYLFFLDK